MPASYQASSVAIMGKKDVVEGTWSDFESRRSQRKRASHRGDYRGWPTWISRRSVKSFKNTILIFVSPLLSSWRMRSVSLRATFSPGNSYFLLPLLFSFSCSLIGRRMSSASRCCQASFSASMMVRGRLLQAASRMRVEIRWRKPVR